MSTIYVYERRDENGSVNGHIETKSAGARNALLLGGYEQIDIKFDKSDEPLVNETQTHTEPLLTIGDVGGGDTAASVAVNAPTTARGRVK